MSSFEEQAPFIMSNLNQPLKKRKQEEASDGGFAKRPKKDEAMDDELKVFQQNKKPVSRSRTLRLEQNRKAARESRRRKKVMIEELQRSLVFFSRTNGVLKQQNEELSRILLDVQAKVEAIESGESSTTDEKKVAGGASKQEELSSVQTVQQPVAQTPASDGFAAATAASPGLPLMQPGATMQAMADFQQAVASAMRAAVKGLGGISETPQPSSTV